MVLPVSTSTLYVVLYICIGVYHYFDLKEFYQHSPVVLTNMQWVFVLLLCVIAWPIVVTVQLLKHLSRNYK